MKFDAQKSLSSYLFCLFLAGVLCLLCSISTSPLYKGFGFDSAIFQVIGKGWSEGKIPYIDLWDHKGPLIFFMDCIGYTITKSSFGVFLLQILSLSVFFLFIQKTFQLALSPRLSYILTVATAFWLACSFSEGNLCEEYCLPWIAASVFYTTLYLKERSPRTLLRLAFVSGIGLGISFLTRLTNGLSICGIMLGVGFCLLSRLEWKSVGAIIGLFTLGAIISVLPFIVYFSIHGAFNDFVFGTLTYNFSYISSTDGISWSALLHKILFAVFPFLLVLICSLILVFVDKNQRMSSLIWLLATLPLFVWYAKSSYYVHYAMLAVPLFPPLLTFFNHSESQIIKGLQKVILCFFIIVPVLYSFRKHSYYKDWFTHNTEIEEQLTSIKNTIPIEERDCFVGWNILPSYYLIMDVTPCYPFFSLQDFQSDKSYELEEAILFRFQSLEAKWILAPDASERIEGILDCHYIKAGDFILDETEYHLFKLEH